MFGIGEKKAAGSGDKKGPDGNVEKNEGEEKKPEKKPILSFTTKKEEPIPIDYSKDLLDFLSRVEVIQNLHNSFTTSHQMHDLKWDTTVSETRREMHKIHSDLKLAKEKIEELKNMFRNTVMNFKECALPEDYEKVKNRIERWNVDEFIGREEFIRWIKESNIR